MLTKKFKLLATMVGLVAVLAMGLMLPGIGQLPQSPPSRADVVNSISGVVSRLVAGTEVLYDPESAAYFSHPEITIALVPRHPSEIEQVRQIVFTEILPGEEGSSVIIGGIYVTDPVEVRDPMTAPHGPFFLLSKGFYTLKLTKDDKVEFVNAEGETVGSASVYIRTMGKIAHHGKGAYVQPGLTPVGKFQIELGFWLPPVKPAVNQSDLMLAGSKTETILVLALLLCIVCY